MGEISWTLIGCVNDFGHRELTEDDTCFFLYEREVLKRDERGQASHAYRTIANFKISPTALKSNPARRKYKAQAIDTIVDDLYGFLAGVDPTHRILLVPAVTSKSSDDPDFDDRLIQVCSRVAARIPNMDSIELLTIDHTVGAAHLRKGPRRVDDLAAHIQVDDTQSIHLYRSILIFDDVISSGAHFKACRKAMESVYGRTLPVYGLFWARTPVR